MQTIVRHTAAARATHWIMAISGTALLISGIAGNARMHTLGAVIFTLAFIIHAVVNIAKHRTAITPKPGDISESVQIIKAMVTDGPEPPQGKYLAEQRLAHAAIAAMAKLLIVSGVICLYYRASGAFLDATFGVALILHHLATGGFVLLVVAHLSAFLFKRNWPLLTSMFSGRVPNAYVEARHSLWERSP
jgi:cytochrome b subunit of formate dehydrogenase